MDLFTHIDGNTVFLFFTVTFSAGALWQKLHTVEQKVEKAEAEKYGERIAVIENKLGI